MMLLFMALSLGFAQEAPAAAPRLALSEAIRLVVAQNPDHSSAQLAAEIAAIEAQRARLDRFSATVAAQAAADLGVVKPYQGDLTRGSDASWAARATVGLPLYAGGAIWANIASADAGADIALRDQEITDRALVRAAYTAYWNIKGYELQISAAQEGLDLTQQALDIIVAKADAGLAAGIDVNRSKVDLYSQQDGLVQQKAALYQAEQELLRLLHMPGDQLVLTDDPPAPATGVVSLASDAGEKRPELARLDLQAKQADSAVILARSAALPAVSLNATTGLSASAVGISTAPIAADDLGPDFDASVGVQLSWDPFDLFKVRDAMAEARLAARQVDASTDGERASIAADIRSAASTVNQLRERAPLVDAQVALARDNLAIVQGLYAQGSTTLLELFNAQSAFRSALTQGASLRVALVTAEYDLRWLMGEDLTAPGALP